MTDPTLKHGDTRFPQAKNDYSCTRCRLGVHVDCKRNVKYIGWDHDCACYKVAVAAHHKLFQQEALLQMIDRVQESGCLVVLPGEPLPVYQLLLSGSQWGLYLTEDGAKTGAQAELDELWRMHHESSDEENADFEDLECRTLTWELQRWHWKLGDVTDDERYPDIPIARFSETGVFSISTIKVKP